MTLHYLKSLVFVLFSVLCLKASAAASICDLYQRCLSDNDAQRYLDALIEFERGDKALATVKLGEIYHEVASNQLIANNYAAMLAATGQHAEAALILEDYLQQDPSVSQVAKNLVNSYNNLSLLGTAGENLTSSLTLLQPESDNQTMDTPLGSLLGEGLDDMQADSDALFDPDNTDPSASDIKAVGERLQAYLSAWSRGDIDAYLSFFWPQTSPLAGITYNEWREQRYARVKPSRQIDVTANDIDIYTHPENTDIIITVFEQHYRSTSYQDSAIKQLEWRQRGDDWLIVTERQR